MRTRIGVLFAVSMAAWLWACPPAHAQSRAGGAFQKLGRGFVNTFTGWVEIPKRVSETAQARGAAAGLTWGVLRGIGYGFFRTAAGLYECVTFPFPAPPDYLPVIQPEYVFTDEELSSSPSRSR